MQPFYFDYGDNSTTWAADRLVAGCLAEYIAAVSEAYGKKSGGDRKVILVGHSMGGLASLYAAQNDRVRDRVGGLVTFDTPYLGSPFGNTAVAKVWQQVRLNSESCTITNDAMLRIAAPTLVGPLAGAIAELKFDENALDGLIEGTMTPALAVYLGVATLTAGCGHIKVTEHGPALDHAAAALKQYLGRLAPGTTVRDLTPVTAGGEVAPGWSVVDDTNAGGVDCSYNIASPVAKKGDIYFCSPSAAMADARWVETGRASMLCLSDPMSRRVVRYRMEGATGGAASPTGPAEHSGTPAPLRLDLDNGAKCRIRNGGSWGVQEENPDLVGFHSCDGGLVVWAGRSSRTGINQSGKSWTVRTGKETGGLTTREVRVAYYVATA
ncbi:alpha/beta fold hydrolase [Actinoplanes sp. NPDC048796]|uniref:alpha/beta fold hydrolase n=1 Tax=unclassified Actinoplanes TaxID=2626549 RepID=UPI0033D7566A